MRNLKKFLALVLAMMMAFSLMVTANAANEKDNGIYKYADDTVSDEFKEAVDVLYGMGIMTGDNGSFYGDRPVMRSEMSAVLYRLVTGDTKQLKSPLYASIAAERFSDVNEGDWFAPYIGYCYSAGLVKGYDGKFNPWGNVNGYETLIMVLRAMGYGQNGEYEGAYWSVKASADGTQYGLLDDVDKSHYANTLAQNTVREVVASIVFNGAQEPTVTWTPSLGYNKYDGVALAPSGSNNRLNLSLGKMYFGLDYTYGIVVGNQSTGESQTRVNVLQSQGEWTDNYKYDDEDTKCAILHSNWTTDLELFGHEVKVWFNAGTTRGTNFGNDKYARNTYAIRDEVELAKVVAVKDQKDADLSKTDKDSGDLGERVKLAGFGLRTAEGEKVALWNYAFGPSTDTPANTESDYESPIMKNNSSTEAQYYLVISNNPDKLADLVIVLDLTVTRISQSSDGVWGTDFVSVNNGVANTYFGEGNDTVPIKDTFGVAKGNRVNIREDSLGTSSITTLGKDVVAVKITGTNDENTGADGKGNTGNTDAAPLKSDFYHELFELKNTVTKVVIWRDPVTQAVTFEDGTTMNRSWLADTVADNRLLDLGANASDNTAENIKRTVAPTVKGEYTFTTVKNADGVDEYVFWSVEKNTKTFIYGTYLDYDQPKATSSFTYPLVGVIDGKMVTRNIVTGTEYVASGTEGSYLDPMNSVQYAFSELPKRDEDGKIGADVKLGDYRGFYINADGELTPVVYENNMVDEWKQGGTDYFDKADGIKIEARDANVGAVLVGSNSDTQTGLYLTNNSKIYLVEGTGTDTQKIYPFDGIKALLGTSASVTINGDDKPDGSGDLATDNEFYKMIYWTQSPSDYAQDYTTTSWAVDEIYIPLEAIERVNTNESSLYFIGDRTVTWVNDKGTEASQFTMYDVNGNKQAIWILGKDEGTASKNPAEAIIDAPNDNFFLLIEPTTKKTNDGAIIYTIKPVSTDATDDDLRIIGQYIQAIADAKNGDWAITLSEANDDPDTSKCFEYIANNYGLQLASIGASRKTLWDVSGAKVVNLDEDTYPGVKDVRTLNAASSMGTTETDYTANEAVHVSAVRNTENGVKLDVIFVNTNQDSPRCSH